MKISRSRFLRMAAGAVACTSLGRHAKVFAASGRTADLVLTGGVITTMNDAKPFVSAMAIRDGKVLAVGTDLELSDCIANRTRVIKLAGRGVSPGLIDAHSHPMAYGHMELMFVVIRPPKVTDFDSLKRTLSHAAKSVPKGEWIVARGFQDFQEGHFPGRAVLDDAVPDHPVLTIHWSGQYGVANTAALKKAGLFSPDVEDPYGGKFVRERTTGLPNGVLIHYPAIYAVYKPVLNEQDMLKCIRWAVQQFHSAGVTCIHDNFVLPQHNKNYVKMEREGDLNMRIRLYPYIANLQQAETVLAKMVHYRGSLVRVQGIKLAVDGYALMYESQPEHQHIALPMHPQPIFEQIIAAIHRGNWQVDVHAAGDKGVDWTLQAFEKAAGGVRQARERRHRIEHFAFRKLDSIHKAAEMDVPVCVQPTLMDFRVDDFTRRLGSPVKKYMGTIVPTRTFLQQGVPLAFGADVPAFPYFAPLDSIRCAMSRKTHSGRQLDTAESISFMEALRVHTRGSAYAAFDETELGSLEPGKAADFVIWDRDLRNVKTPGDVSNLHVQATYLAGRCVYQAKET